MYVDPFLFGIFVTLSIEAIIVVIAGLFIARKKK